jgi:two-component system, NtrC family, nitrogen regulation response regulator NtrX
MSEIKQRLLIVDDDESVIAGLTSLLENDYDVRSATTGRAAIQKFGETPDLVLLDIQLPDTSGIELLKQFKAYEESVPVVMISGMGTFEQVVEAMKNGAESFLQKPFDYDTLQLTLAGLQSIIATRRELAALRRGDAQELERIPGISPAIRTLNATITEVARASSPVLIDGESGTGKGVLAKLIHRRSPRVSGPFVDLNCAGLSRELLESELFGHERGAFTGATTSKPGLFEIANAGTVFLDEIGEMDLTIQARLLKAVEEKKFRRVGGVRDLSANFRLIAATNRDLPEDVASGRFRRDLYYRLNVVHVHLPPLRERLEDVPILVDVILPPLAKELGLPHVTVSQRAMDKLTKYPFPGNVRELRNVLERALLRVRGNEIRTEELILSSDESSPLAPAGGGLPASEWEIRPLDDVMSDYVTAAAKAVDGNLRKAARLLHISPSTLYAKLKK